MPAIITIENDASIPVTSVNFGAVSGGSFQQLRMNATNTGTTTASALQLFLVRVASNDGVDFAQIAPDVSGNPGTYSTNPLNVGTLAAGATYWFWVIVSVASSASPQGNPRTFGVEYSMVGT